MTGPEKVLFYRTDIKSQMTETVKEHMHSCASLHMAIVSLYLIVSSRKF